MAQRDDNDTSRKSGIAYAAAIALFVSVAAMWGIGWLVDRRLGTGPWFMVVGLVIGAIVGFYEFIRLTSKLS